MKQKILLAILFSMLCLMSNQAAAGGLYLYEVGGEDVGLASAGLAARAQDAGTILGNPAGMTRLNGDQLSTGLQVLTGNANYHLSDSSAVQGSSPGNVIEPFPSASLFYSHSVDDRLKVGIGIYGDYGLALHYGDWAAQSLVKDAALTALTVQPTVAYKLSDHWSIGAGLGINYGYFSLKRQTQDGEQKDSDHDWATNAHVGVLFELNPSTRFGLTYTSETDYNFKVNPTGTVSYMFHPLPGGAGFTVTRDITLPLAGLVKTPQQVMFSAFHELNAQWNIMGNLGWQNWSRYSASSISVAGNELAGNDRLRDTWHAAIGVQYQFSSLLRLDGGIAYDSSFYKSQSNASLTMPSGAAWRFGIGAQYRMSPQSTLGASFEYLQMQGSTVQSPLIGGQFNTNHLYFVAVNYSHQF
ncbi:47 kDa outer membrane protein [Caballeronia novacaledonica]|uniref:47 kDa outer membrane protein n=1 Tax=Caballeronia novacaledonica TaxID=1544861 RepID=A0A2U3I224_9BURK|nr:outer membrane protein transport protein [Caballeronia novacaledonica]SPB14172.1 47 kDa outer membrane protein [Caballeronia novacaledonica]